jgi:ATPase family associated with various cellular activities (AAA)
MLTTPATEKIAAAPDARAAEPATWEQRKSNLSTSMVCELSQAPAFFPMRNTPHVPVLAAFGGDRLHVCRLEGSWDLERAISENADNLFRSIRFLPAKHANESSVGLDDLTFQFGRRTFLCADRNRIVAYASTPAEAEQLVRRFSKAYHKPPAACGGTFYLIEQGRQEITCQTVTLPPATILSAESLSLHYGPGSDEWHRGFVEKLNHRANGLSIFEGRPGTGKTSYLRHLMGVLKESHRFYFVPTSTMGVLSQPEFIGFWAEQRRNHASRRFVVILEDSDAALMTRSSDNREQVSAILNLSDGMLADFLRLQIICTINCSTAEIDPALLRPGRLLCHRVFGRLDYAQATRLAESLGRKLPMASDYSLAEVFAGHEGPEINRPRIGFAA